MVVAEPSHFWQDSTKAHLTAVSLQTENLAPLAPEIPTENQLLRCKIAVSRGDGFAATGLPHIAR
jgi:hypothetical protein